MGLGCNEFAISVSRTSASGETSAQSRTAPADCREDSPRSGAARQGARKSRSLDGNEAAQPGRTRSRRLTLCKTLIAEVGYLSYSNRHADLLFELVSRRYGVASTVVTTNRAFGEWHEVFPNAACVVSLVDRLVHRAEVVVIEGESYRVKEARERAEQRTKKRSAAKAEKKTS